MAVTPSTIPGSKPFPTWPWTLTRGGLKLNLFYFMNNINKSQSSSHEASTQRSSIALCHAADTVQMWIILTPARLI